MVVMPHTWWENNNNNTPAWAVIGQALVAWVNAVFIGPARAGACSSLVYRRDGNGQGMQKLEKLGSVKKEADSSTTKPPPIDYFDFED
ncbi:hypothetical protein E2C01_078878 [Portunus trituberculatus]|uniref:Uncharacterized protein n=1 Tax=Portunus trituberculatus TaxID=210409 RepID=A0A5B7IHZ7_PORTR|nr:hypothetical protein [Portunus trituberculatus]